MTLGWGHINPDTQIRELLDTASLNHRFEVRHPYRRTKVDKTQCRAIMDSKPQHMIWGDPATTPLYDMGFPMQALKTPDAYDGDTLEPPSEHLAICYDDMRLKIHGEKEKVWKAPAGRILDLQQLTEPKITLACNSYVREKSRMQAWLG